VAHMDKCPLWKLKMIYHLVNNEESIVCWAKKKKERSSFKD